MDTFQTIFPASVSPVYVLALASIVLLYLIAILGSRFWLTALRRGKRIRRVLLPAQPSIIAYRAADERRRKILEVLEEHENSDYPGAELIEIPPGYAYQLRDDRYERNSDEERASYWWLARLRMQLSETHYLLTERVTDLIVTLFRAGQLRPDQFPSLIFVERVQHQENDDLFPWQVVIETNSPEAITQWFVDKEVSEWIGIGVQLSVPRPSKNSPITNNGGTVAPPSAFPNGKCIDGKDGLEGTMGGVFNLPSGEALGVTCWHVLGAECRSRVWPVTPGPGAPNFNEKYPDVAIINLGGPCFPVEGTKLRRVSTANAGQIDAALQAFSIMRKSSSNHRPDGVIRKGYVSSFTLGNSFYRGHHFSVELDFKNVLGIIVPLSRHYSEPGDSGAWILDDKFERWFGMVVGGFTSPGIETIALSAELITRAYRQHLKKTLGAATFIYPETYLH
ncbi:hypothetical protein QF019_002178 [Pseudomonas frederiksbergensis]|uniref:hypothetical protein n=1 Tax=Pseudomonas frederiksbergensis TaxID=104087 RepID=UPI003D1D5389